MNDHNLDDLIIDNISPKNAKTKSFLTLIALAIVVLIIAIILTKIILKDPQSESRDIDENSVYISPDLTLDSIDTEKELVKAPHIPTTEEVKSEISMPANTVTSKNTNTVKNVHTIDDVAIESEKRKQLETQAKAAQRQIDLKEVKEAKEAQKQIELSKAREKKAREEAISEDKDALKRKQEESSKITKQQATQPLKKEDVAHPYFIQVGSFSKAPSTRFLNVIRKSGFHYKITTSTNNGNKKLLIGPYDTKAAVDQALAKVKDRINKSAFIIKK